MIYSYCDSSLFSCHLKEDKTSGCGADKQELQANSYFILQKKRKKSSVGKLHKLEHNGPSKRKGADVQ